VAGLAEGGCFTLEGAMAALDRDERGTIRAVESLIDTGAVTSPSGEVTAHAALYEVPRLLCLYVREEAGPEGAGAREPALSPGSGASRLLSRG
ncbi:AfsR family transcriptional regulator, partial [Streptomyces sp. ME02-6979-3A]|nr:AfsR family transcriptional regulator [Streptomyces sp. ME02-6979-3A]